MPDINLEQLIAAAQRLHPLLHEIVFEGGSVAGLLITDEAAGDPRPTLDVDAIAEIASYAEYAAFGDRLRALGFHEDAREGAPLCRWICQTTILDIMPLDEGILGFSNRWYSAAMAAAVWRRLADDLEIRVVTAPFFVATKLAAYQGRGKGDLFGSRDLEDLIAVIDGRASLLAEVRAETAELQTYLRVEINGLLATRGFLDALPGYLLPDAASQLRIGIVRRRFEELALL